MGARSRFVGREQELRSLEAMLVDASSERLVLVTGEPGIGKTRIAEELTRKAESAGWLTAWGRTWEGEGTPACFPWIQVLRKLGVSAARSLVDDARTEIPELDALVGAGRARVPRAPADPAEAQFRLFDAITGLVRRITEEAPLLIVLDDLHAADRATLRLLHFVARELRGEPRVLVLGTARDTAYTLPAGLEELLAQVGREARALALGRLAKEDVATWLGEVAPALASNAEDVFAVSDGNPLFVQELLAASTKRGALAWVSTRGLPLNIRHVIRTHLGHLSPESARVVEVASVFGREFSVEALFAIAGDASREGLEEAVSLGVLTRTSGDRVSFAHVLLHDELYGRMDSEDRAEIHRRVAAHFEREPPIAIEHWLVAARAEDIPHASDVAALAIHEAVARLAFEDAARLGERVLAVLGPRGLETMRAADLEVAIAEAWSLAGKNEAARAAASRVAGVAASRGDGRLLARAALVHAGERRHGGRDPDSISLLREALVALGEGDSPLRAEVMARLSVALLPPTPEDLETIEELQRDALAMAHRLGDDVATFGVLRFATAAPPRNVTARERVALNAEAIRLGVRLGEVSRIAPVLAWQPIACMEDLDPDAAMRAADEAEELLLAFHQANYRWRVPLMRAVLASHHGRFAEAEALSRDALQIANDHDIGSAKSLIPISHIVMHYARGDREGLEEVMPLYVQTQQSAFGGLFLTLPEAMLGQKESVRRRLDRGAHLLHAIPGSGVLGWACVLADATDYAARYLELVLDELQKTPWISGPGGMVSMGPRALLAGRLSEMIGRTEDALRFYEDARAVAERVRSAPYVAQSDLAWARALAPRDAAAARLHADQAHSLASALRMKTVAAEAAELAASLGSSSTARARQPETRAHPELRLVRDGETWRMFGAGPAIVLRHSKGLVYLNELVMRPHEEVHVLSLVGAEDAGDAGPMLDEKARRAYRERAADLRETLEEATNHGDLGRAERARTELDALARELSRAVGLGGRDRHAASATQRARINVQRRLREVMRRVGELDPALAEHLELSVRTGVACMYAPTWPR